MRNSHRDFHFAERIRFHVNFFVGLGGVEPPTSRLSGVRSNHLSYKPLQFGKTTHCPAGLIDFLLDVELRGFEPRTLCLQSRCSSQLSYSPRQKSGDTIYRRDKQNDEGLEGRKL